MRTNRVLVLETCSYPFHGVSIHLEADGEADVPAETAAQLAHIGRVAFLDPTDVPEWLKASAKIVTAQQVVIEAAKARNRARAAAKRAEA